MFSVEFFCSPTCESNYPDVVELILLFFGLLDLRKNVEENPDIFGAFTGTYIPE
jgi:hypothetical protein